MQQKDKINIEKREKQEKLITEDYKALFDPKNDPNIQGDPYKTLFVSRLSYDTEAADLEREFKRYGPLQRVRIVTDNGKRKEAQGKVARRKGKSRGYAFVVFERERDMKEAYKNSSSMKIRGRPVIVDVERGRTVDNWRPRRFGGGLGGRHYTKVTISRFSGPPSGPVGFRGGFSGGRGGRGGRPPFRGGFGGYNRYQNDGPDGAPSGPRQGGGYGGRSYGRGGSGGYDDRGSRNANLEPVQPRRDNYRDRDSGANPQAGSKRPYEGYDHDEPRTRRRY